MSVFQTSVLSDAFNLCRMLACVCHLCVFMRADIFISVHTNLDKTFCHFSLCNFVVFVFALKLFASNNVSNRSTVAFSSDKHLIDAVIYQHFVDSESVIELSKHTQRQVTFLKKSQRFEGPPGNKYYFLIFWLNRRTILNMWTLGGNFLENKKRKKFGKF